MSAIGKQFRHLIKLVNSPNAFDGVTVTVTVVLRTTCLPCTGGLSAVSAIGKQFRHLIKLVNSPNAFDGVDEHRRRGKRD